MARWMRSCPTDGGDCEEVLAQFGKAGIDVDALAARLQDEGRKVVREVVERSDGRDHLEECRARRHFRGPLNSRRKGHHHANTSSHKRYRRGPRTAHGTEGLEGLASPL